MQIIINNNNYHNNFRANIKSYKLNFTQKDFFVRIKGYGRNTYWANKMKDTADTATELIRMKISAENTLKIIALKVKDANSSLVNIAKATHTGIIRFAREGWNGPSEDWGICNLITSYSYKSSRYKTYQDKLDNVSAHPLNKPYQDISLTRPFIGSRHHYIRHGQSKYLNNAFQHIFKIYNHFINTYNYKDITTKQLVGVNNDIAGIRWILAHATPWERGSDTISNVFMRAMYKSLGIKTYPLKKGISLDLEAYCTNYREYKKRFTEFFEKKPEIIE